MEKENFKNYVLYGINGKITFKECIQNGIVIIIFSLISFCNGMENNIFIILNILPIITYSIAVYKLKGGTIEGVYCFLHNGILAICFSYIFGLASIEIVCNMLEGIERIIIINIIIVGYIAVMFLYKYILRKLIKENAYSSNSGKIRGGLFFTIFAILGISMGKIFWQGMNDRSSSQLECILFLVISYICLMGIFNICKYRYLKDHKELLDKG